MSAELTGWIKKVNSRYKADEKSPVIYQSSDSGLQRINRLRTGIFALDFQLFGGIPQGRITSIWGPFSSGKSWIAMRIIRENQHLCRHCWNAYTKQGRHKCCADPEPFRVLWIDAEGAWDHKWAGDQGIAAEQVVLMKPDFHEQGLDTITAGMESRLFDYVVLDSLAGLPGMKEAEKSLEAAPKVAEKAMANNRAFGHWQAIQNSAAMRANPHAPALVVINQLRDSLDEYHPEYRTGGRGQEYAESVSIKVWAQKDLTNKGQLITLGQATADHGDPVARQVGFLINKNKTAPAHRSGEFIMWFAKDPHWGRDVGASDSSQMVVDYGLRYGVLVLRREGKNQSYVAMVPGQDPVVVAGKKADCKHALMQMPAVLRAMEDQIVAKAAAGEEPVAAVAVEEEKDAASSDE
jgi:RecA/RadA recombinase